MSRILECFEAIVREHPDKPAVELRENQLTFQELASFSKRIGSAINNLDISKNQ